MSGFITRIEREKEEPYTVIFTTDDHGKYLHIENECRIMIDHAKPQTNADHIRAMTDEELADFMIRAAQRGGKPTDSGLVHWRDWLKEEAEK